MIRSTIVVLAIALSSGLASFTAFAQTSTGLLARFDAEVPALLEKHQEPGIAITLVDRCEASVRTYGLARREPAVPVRATTVFNLGSISKTLTAWTVMTLVEAGRIRLDDPIDRHLKRWRLPESAFDRSAVTVQRLLTHTAGVSMPSASGTDRGTVVPSLIDELNGTGPTATRVELIKAPGDSFDYSGGGYAILQLLVEDVTGLSLAEYAKRTVFAPLGMTSTSFGWAPEAITRTAVPYLADGSAYVLRDFSALAAAGLVSTAEDMGKFLVAHCSHAQPGAKGAVLSAATLEQMRTTGVSAPTLGRGASYGLGYTLFAGPSPIYNLAGHSGSNRGWKAEFMMMPAQGFGIAILTNAADGKTRNDVLTMFRNEFRTRVTR